VNWTPGPFSVRGEYIRSQEARVGQGVGGEQALDDTLPDYIGRGWYVGGTWAITGEKKAGGIEPKKPFLQGGFGAIEVVGRIESLAFAGVDTREPPSRSRRAANPGGNTEHVVTVGVNWYLNKWVKVLVNQIGEQIENLQYSPVPSQNRFWNTVLRLQFAM
jgi:phosphate-selective porin